MHAEHHIADARVHVRLGGELDASHGEQLQAWFQGLLDDGHDAFAVDTSAVRFLDSSGLRVLLLIEERCRGRGGYLRLTEASGAVRHVLELTDLEQRFGLDAADG